VFSTDGTSSFFGSANRNSSIASTSSYEHKDNIVNTIKIDSIIPNKIDYIKYDVEGAELEALQGSDKVISEYKPTLLVSAYHRSCDIFTLINYINNKYKVYNIHLHRLRAVPAWEIDIIAKPK
jgi:hypothetical protein